MIMSPPFPEKDIESVNGPSRISYWKLLTDQGVVTSDVLNWTYEGKGTELEPYVVTWIDDDQRNPLNFPQWRKWLYVLCMAIATLSVSFSSSGFAGGMYSNLSSHRTKALTNSYQACKK